FPYTTLFRSPFFPNQPLLMIAQRVQPDRLSPARAAIEQIRQPGCRQTPAVLVEYARLAVGNQQPALPDKLADGLDLPVRERARPRQDQDAVSAMEQFPLLHLAVRDEVILEP